MSIEALADEAISQLNKRITDEIFMIIQNDRNLMKQYIKLAEEHTHEVVNRSIGKRVKKEYNLSNQERGKSPTSTLIDSYQEFE